MRWTENRNLEAFLALAAAGAVDPERLDVEMVPFDGRVRAYDELARGERRSLAIVFRYPDASVHGARHARRAHGGRGSGGRCERHAGRLLPRRGELREGGAAPGSRRRGAAPAPDARRRHRRLRAAHAPRASTSRIAGPIRKPSSPTPPSGSSSWRRATTATPRSRSARSAPAKAVWLEKPVGLTPDEVDRVLAAARETGGFLAVGYNRRFSPHARAIRAAFAGRSGPLAIHYSVSAGPVPAGTWITDPVSGGGRIVGEACHFVDLCAFLAGAPPVRVFAQALGRDPERDDSLVAQLGFADGSSATLHYLAGASSELPKERLEVSGAGQTALCDNFRQTRILGGKGLRTVNQDKGQATAVREVLDAVREGRPSPFGLEEIAGVSRATFALLESARSGREVALA